jgi:uncharacterized protein (TIGR02147 family)
MRQTLFEFSDYKKYLRKVIESKPGGGRGFRIKIAEAVGCQAAFVSQVLQKSAHFNLEHGEKVNFLLGHGKQEAHYFLLLIQLARAGTRSLEKYFEDQIAEIREQRENLKTRMPPERDLLPEDEATYYSAWYYGAIRVALTIPGIGTKDALLQRLGLRPEVLNSALEFLISRRLVEQNGDQLLPGVSFLYLGKNSPNINRHHTNWRLRAIAGIEQKREKDVHFSSVLTLSRQDLHRLSATMSNFVESIVSDVRTSPEETLISFCLDFFEL